MEEMVTVRLSVQSEETNVGMLKKLQCNKRAREKGRRMLPFLMMNKQTTEEGKEGEGSSLLPPSC
jgi:hypothetical protein